MCNVNGDALPSNLPKNILSVYLKFELLLLLFAEHVSFGPPLLFFCNQGMVRIPIFRNPMCLKEYRVNHASLPIG